jgi:ABC-type nitrate/sulfonate/bicarbonate transport system permease component
MWNPYLPIASRTRQTLGLASVIAVLLIWAVITGLSLVSAAKLPSPWAVAQAFLHLAWDPERGESLLLIATLWSTCRVLVAGLLVVALGVPVGVLMGASPYLNGLLSPLIDPFRSAPVVALLPVLVMWLGIGEAMKVTFLFLGAVVYLIPMVRDAMLAVPSHYWVSARDLGATPWEAVRHAVLPMAMPRIMDAIIVSTSVLWTYITVAEYVNPRQGLGHLIQSARRFSAMDQVLVGIFVIIALALLSYSLMTALKRRLYPWEVA